MPLEGFPTRSQFQTPAHYHFMPATLAQCSRAPVVLPRRPGPVSTMIRAVAVVGSLCVRGALLRGNSSSKADRGAGVFAPSSAAGGGTDGWCGGTACQTPDAAGIAALILADDPAGGGDLSADEVLARMTRSAPAVGGFPLA